MSIRNWQIWLAFQSSMLTWIWRVLLLVFCSLLMGRTSIMPAVRSALTSPSSPASMWNITMTRAETILGQICLLGTASPPLTRPWQLPLVSGWGLRSGLVHEAWFRRNLESYCDWIDWLALSELLLQGWPNHEACWCDFCQWWTQGAADLDFTLSLPPSSCSQNTQKRNEGSEADQYSLWRHIYLLPLPSFLSCSVVLYEEEASGANRLSVSCAEKTVGAAVSSLSTFAPFFHGLFKFKGTGQGRNEGATADTWLLPYCPLSKIKSRACWVFPAWLLFLVFQ